MVVSHGEPQHVYQIVGLIRNSKYRQLRDNFIPTVFVADSQNKEPGMGTHFIVRSGLPTGSAMQAVKKTLLDQNAGTSVQFQVFKTQVQESLLKERLMATLSGFFGFLAAILATVGLYGVISYMVARRRNEIGIRIALGRSRQDLVSLVRREAARLIGTGLVSGS